LVCICAIYNNQEYYTVIPPRPLPILSYPFVLSNLLGLRDNLLTVCWHRD